MTDSKSAIVVGGGAAGFFGAINLAEARPDIKVTLIERSKKVLEKVRVSGGGRCNVCHAEFEPRELVKAYPRGGKALWGPFSRFCSGDTMAWFEDRGVPLKIEEDGRIFPVSDNSASIVNCLRQSAESAGVRVILSNAVEELVPGPRWKVRMKSGFGLQADAVLLAPGASPRMWELLGEMGHRIVAPVPSLFTFNIRDPRIQDLPGLSVPMGQVSIPGTKLSEQGPILVTHWGLSGPAVLKTSSWGARVLHERNYQFEAEVAWVPGKNEEEMVNLLGQAGREQSRKTLAAHSMFELPSRLWKRLVAAADIPEDLRWADLNKKQLRSLARELVAGKFQVEGKSTFKEEFVTCGGIHLKEVDFKTMESKLFPGLYFAGEFLDIDAVTGGYNFQAAWTTSWIAAQAIAEG